MYLHQATATSGESIVLTISIYKCKKPCNGAWTHVPGGLKQIDRGHKYVYGVNSINDIYSRPVDGSGNWRQIPGKLIHISASGTDEVFGVNAAHTIYRCRKPCIGGGRESKAVRCHHQWCLWSESL